jgi:NAD(P)-dependent dehydrogenase (short-subunit alcohol dehydrogenase family)
MRDEQVPDDGLKLLDVRRQSCGVGRPDDEADVREVRGRSILLPNDAQDLRADFFGQLDGLDEAEANSVLARASSDGEDEDSVLGAQSGTAKPCTVGGGPAFVVDAGRKLGDVVRGRIALEVTEFAEVVDGVSRVSRPPADPENEQAAASSPHARELFGHRVHDGGVEFAGDGADFREILLGKGRHSVTSVSLLRDRRIVVVGATGGIGSAVAGELLGSGARLLATGRDSAGLERLATAGATALELDLADIAAPEELAAAARDRFHSALDGLVVATGSLEPIGPTRSVELEALARSLRAQLVAALGLIQACAPLLDAGNAPSVVLFSGGGATGPLPRYTAYALAKVAIVRLVENLALEEPEWKVNAVAPGFVATRIHDSTRAAGAELAGPYHDETLRRLNEAVPPEEAAALVAFLLSNESRGISGRLISAVWDDWREESCQELLRAHPSFGRLRRIDLQQFSPTEEQ